MIVYAIQNTRDSNGKITDKSYLRLDLTIKQAKWLDNGALISCGLSFCDGDYPGAPDELSQKVLQSLRYSYVTAEQYNHSGCQSACVLRGASKCNW